MKCFPATTLLGLGVTSKNEQLKQIRVTFYPWIHFSTDSPSLFKHLSHLSTSLWMPDAKKNEVSCCASYWRTAYCTSISDANFCPPRIFFIGHLLPYTGRISLWTAFALCPLVHKKMNNGALHRTGRFTRQCCHNYRLLTTSQYRHW